MKISEFIISATGLLYSMKTSNLAALIIFGILAIMAFRRIMFDVGQMEMEDEKKKTEKRKIVQLTDDYIRNLESYLNSQEKEVRLNAAKEVYARLAEDESRHDDKALTALINKMLQDPSEEIRLIALSALEGRIVTGNDYTVGVLQKMQQKSDGYGQDAVDASNILLKMSGKQVEKEFEVKDNQKKESSNKEGQKQESKKA